MKKKKLRFSSRGQGALAMRADMLDMFFYGYSSANENRIENGIGILSIMTPLAHHAEYFFDSYESIEARFAELCGTADVKAIVLRIDSPGGEVSGMVETVNRMRGMAAASGKPVIAFADEQAASAAYCLATVADEIYAPASAMVGSVGTLMEVYDRTAANEKAGIRVAVIRSGELKATGHPDLPLDDATLAEQADRVNRMALAFAECVAVTRGVEAAALLALKGACMLAPDAVSAGLCDGILSWTDLTSAISATYGEGTPMNKKKIAAAKALADAKSALLVAKTTKNAKVIALAEAEVKRADGVVTSLSAEAVTVEVATAEDALPDDDEVEPDEDDAAEAEAEAEAEAQALAFPATQSGLVSLVKSITGKTTIAGSMGALRALAASAENIAGLRAELTTARKAAHTEKLNATIVSALKSKRLTPGKEKWARALGATAKGYVQLVSFIKATEPMSAEDLGDEGAELAERHEPEPKPRGAAAGTVSPKMLATMGITQEQYDESARQIAARNARH